MSEMNSFEPRILAFCCHHCAYAAADLAGAMRLQYPANVRVIGIPCSGKLDVVQVLHAFERGIDGVMVAGWLTGDCHYLEGNLVAKRRVEYVAGLLDQIGLGGERVQMYNLSSAMGARFAEFVADMTQKIKEIGPNPLQ
jgi:F420-non-reducing hydrogenase iron-sulfur subunit